MTVSPLGHDNGQGWMTVTLADARVQNPVMTVSAQANTSANSRYDYIQVITGDTGQGSWTLKVIQAGAAKVPISVAAKASLPADSGREDLDVSAADGVSPCNWAVATDQLPDWVKPKDASGVCGTPLQFSYDANPNSSVRLGSIKFNTGDAVQLEQAAAQPACTFGFQQQQFSVGAAGDTVTFNVTTGPNCSWSAATNHDSWIQYPNGNGGTGPGPLSVQVLANDTTSQRTLTITVDQTAGYVLQDAAQVLPPACGFTLSPNAASFGSGGGNNTFQVQTDSSCPWKASVTSGADWLTITSRAGATGPGPVSFTADPNPQGSAARTGTISVEGTIFTINEDAGAAPPANCSYALAPGSASFGNAGGSGSFQVQTADGCSWQATQPSADTWVKIQTGSAPGPGSVTFTVDANPPGSPARSTVITAGGRTFQIDRDAGPAGRTTAATR